MPPRSIKPSNPEGAARIPGQGLARFDRAIEAVALWGGGGAVLALVLLVVGDVLLRYFFNAPLFGARDLGKLLLLTTVALAVPYSARTGGQVAIEVFSGFLGPGRLRIVEIGVRCGATVMLAILAWRLCISGLDAGHYGETSLTLGIPYAPFYFLFAFGMFLYAAVLVVEIVLLCTGHSLAPHSGEEDAA